MGIPGAGAFNQAEELHRRLRLYAEWARVVHALWDAEVARRRQARNPVTREERNFARNLFGEIDDDDWDEGSTMRQMIEDLNAADWRSVNTLGDAVMNKNEVPGAPGIVRFIGMVGAMNLYRYLWTAYRRAGVRL